MPRLVLVRPRNVDNLVSIAKARAQFGFGDWVAVSLAKHYDGLMELARTRRPAGEAEAIASLRRVETLEEAVEGCGVVVGTTMRELPNRPRMTTRELAAYGAKMTAPWALVFGAEANGLQDGDLKHCNALSFIPAEVDQPSLNLSQAVVVYGYELSLARAEASTATNVSELRELRSVIADSMRSRGLPRRAADEVLAPLVRATLTEREAALLRAAWRLPR